MPDNLRRTFTIPGKVQPPQKTYWIIVPWVPQLLSVDVWVWCVGDKVRGQDTL